MNGYYANKRLEVVEKENKILVTKNEILQKGMEDINKHIRVVLGDSSRLSITCTMIDKILKEVGEVVE